MGYKTDRETGAAISGAVFGLFYADETEFVEENAILTAVTDEDGVFRFERLPYGSYVISELAPAEGYLANDTRYDVTIARDGQLIEIGIGNDLIPEIGTTAEIDGEKEVCATEVFTLTDTIEYLHLVPGKEYTVIGILMDQAAGEPFLEDGKQIISQVSFTPDSSTGTVEVAFTFDARLIKTDTKIVVFESLYSDGVELAVHADLDDEGQTVTIKVPEIRTTAAADGEKEITAAGTVTIEDTVSYTNLTPGVEYTLKGTLMNKTTGEVFTVDGRPIVAEVVFTPETSDGEIAVPFTFNASGITEATELVVFEALYREDVEIAVHADIEDADQTVTVTPPAPDVPQTSDNSSLGVWLGLGAVALGGLVACLVLRIKRKKNDSEE